MQKTSHLADVPFGKGDERSGGVFLYLKQKIYARKIK